MQENTGEQKVQKIEWERIERGGENEDDGAERCQEGVRAGSASCVQQVAHMRCWAE